MGILKNRLGLLATVAALPFLIYLSWHYTFTSVGPLAETGRRVEIPDKADIVIGILPEQNVFIQKKRFEPLEEYLSRKLDRKVRFKLLADYADMAREIDEKKLEGGFFGSLNFVLTKLRTDIDVLARPLWSNGESTYRGYIFTRRDTGLNADPSGWKGRSMAMVSRATTAGYLFPTAYLRKRGVSDATKYFARCFFTGSHDAAALAVFRREADLGACKSEIFDQMRDRDAAFREAMTILAVSEAVPSNGLAVRSDLPPRVKDGLRAVLLRMDQEPEGRSVLERFNAQSFIETRLKDYDPVYKMAEDAGLDLSRCALSDAAAASNPGTEP